MTILDSVNLDYSCTTMTKDVIIMSLSIRKKCVCAKCCIQMVDIGCSKLCFELLTKIHPYLHLT